MSGWLGAAALLLIVLFGIHRGRRRQQARYRLRYPYEKREQLLTAAEVRFLRVLEEVCEDQFRIFAQVRLADVLNVCDGLAPQTQRTAQYQINGKHVDYVLCHPKSLAIVAAVELDDSSHQRPDRQQRDHFLNEACRLAGLPLLRVPVQARYDADDIREVLQDLLKSRRKASKASKAEAPRRAPIRRPTPDTLRAPKPTAPKAPSCPECGSPMLLRVAKRGQYAGRSLWGCRQYPHCRGLLPYRGEA